MKKRILIILCMFISPGLFSQADFRMIIETALEKGEKNISIPTGTYTLMSEDYESVTLTDLKNISIDANGSTIICKKPSRAFDLINCENVRLSNFSIDYDPLPFTQGRIIEMDEGKNWWIVEIFEGYPTEGIELRMNRMNIYDPETNLYKENMKTFVNGDFKPEIEYLGERKIKLYKSDSDSGNLQDRKGHNEEVGDLFLMLVREENCRSHAIVLENSKWCKLDNVTIYTAPMFGIVEHECEATHYYQCVITKNLNDPKVGYPRLRSAGGDAFHSKSAYKGPVVEECTFEYQGDDCINIGTRFHIVMKSEGSSVYILSTSNSTYIEPGNRLQVISSQGQLKGESVVESIEPVSGFSEQELTKATDMFRLRSVPHFVIRLDLEKSLPFSRGDLVCSLDKAGDGFILKNNKFGYTRARGALLKGTGGRVIGNTFEGSMLAGITVIPEFYWMEGTFARDLVISGNTFRNCHYGVSVPGSSQCAAITVLCINAENQVIGSEGGGFRDIRIVDNRIVDCPFPAIVLAGIKGGELRGNIIEKSPDLVRNHGANYGFSNKDAISTMYLKDFIIEDNSVTIK